LLAGGDLRCIFRFVIARCGDGAAIGLLASTGGVTLARCARNGATTPTLPTVSGR
jgi:hypothetical protein